MMHLITILLPLNDREGRPYPDSVITKVREELIKKHGGVTAHLRAPAEGAWKPDSGSSTSSSVEFEKDRIVTIEVMVESLDDAQRDWWRKWREMWERELGQEEILITATAIERL